MGLLDQLTTKAVLSAALFAGNPLPASEPQIPAPQSPVEKKETKNWQPAEISEQIGALKSTCDMIDQFFKSSPENKIIADKWLKEEVHFRAMIESAQTVLKEEPVGAILSLTGESLERGTAALRLYLGELIKPPKDINSRPAVIGMYNESDFVGMQTAAQTFRTLLEIQIKQSGKPKSTVEAKIIQGLESIDSAKSPRELAEKLQPMINDALLILTEGRSTDSTELRKSFTGLLANLKSNNRKDPAPLLQNASAEKNWKAWSESGELAKDLNGRLNRGGKMGRVAALAQTMIETPQGLETINFGAGQLAELAMNKDPKMYLTLKSLANAKSIEAVAEIPDCLMIFGNAFITFKFTK